MRSAHEAALFNRVYRVGVPFAKLLRTRRVCARVRDCLYLFGRAIFQSFKIGEGGIVYTQAFMLDYEGVAESDGGNFTDLGFLASMIPDALVKLLGSLSIFDTIYGWIS